MNFDCLYEVGKYDVEIQAKLCLASKVYREYFCQRMIQEGEKFAKWAGIKRAFDQYYYFDLEISMKSALLYASLLRAIWEKLQ